MTIKANELKQGDVIRSEIYSSLWNRMVSTSAVVMDVTPCGDNFSVMAKTKDGFKESVIKIFAKAGSEYEAA